MKINANYKIDGTFLLPRVKATRARLYFRANLRSLKDFINIDSEEIIKRCEAVIKEDNLPLKAPFLKEVKTHIAVAKGFLC